MGRKPATPRDLGLEEIDRWVAWFGDAQLAVIRENPDLHPAERQAALVAAERLAAAVGAHEGRLLDPTATGAALGATRKGAMAQPQRWGKLTEDEDLDAYLDRHDSCPPPAGSCRRCLSLMASVVNLSRSARERAARIEVLE